MDLFITHALLRSRHKDKEGFQTQGEDESSRPRYNWVFWVQLTLYIIFFLVAVFLSWKINGFFEYGTVEKVLYAALSGFMSYWYLVYVILFRRDLLQLYPAKPQNSQQRFNNNSARSAR
jgi:hypothetical protein